MPAPRLPAFDFGRLPGITDEHRQVQDAVRAFVEGEIQPHADAWDEAGSFPRELYRKAGDVGLLGLGYPAEYGGTPVDHVGRLLSSIELARGGIGGVTAGLGSHTIMLWPVLAGAREHVRQAVIPSILAGTTIGALAITEPSGGSDVAQLTTRAERVPGGWSITGSKMFITSGIRADHILVAARTGGPGAGGALAALPLLPGDTAVDVRVFVDNTFIEVRCGRADESSCVNINTKYTCDTACGASTESRNTRAVPPTGARRCSSWEGASRSRTTLTRVRRRARRAARCSRRAAVPTSSSRRG